MLIPIVLSGGVGSRLWPLSRKAKPKHFMPLMDDNIEGEQGVNNKSLLQQTAIRCSKQARSYNNPFVTNPVFVCDKAHRFLVADQCLDINLQPEAILLEPERKDTAAAIILALFYIVEKYPEANVIVSPSDHYMSDMNYYLDRVSDALEHIKNNKIVTFGISPEYPETGYGYINADFSKDLNNSTFRVKKFIEKPELSLAQELLASKEYLWNSGIFMFNAQYLLDLCKQHQPDLYHYCKKTTESVTHDSDFVYFDNEYFSKIEPISIDYALMQDVDEMVVLQYDGQWSDVGCWRGVWKSSPKDTGNNVVMGNVISEDTKNCYLRSDSRLIVTIGVDNLSVIETPDAVLVTPLENSQDLRTIVENSMANQHKEFLEHSHVHRPWGEFVVLGDDRGYKVKKLVVKPGASLSLQSHEHRAEHWVVVSGEANIIRGDESLILSKNDSVYIPIGARHRITNNHETEHLVIIEVQVGNYLGEDDIVRYQDVYGRIPEQRQEI